MSTTATDNLSGAPRQCIDFGAGCDRSRNAERPLYDLPDRFSACWFTHSVRPRSGV